MFLYGSAEEIADRLVDYHAVGVDEVVINTGGVMAEHGSNAGCEDAEEILCAYEERHGVG